MGMSFILDIAVPPATEVREWECPMLAKASHWCIFQALIRSVIRGRGVTQPQSPLHTIGQGTKTSLSCGSLKHSMVMAYFLFHFAFRVPYIYACFYNVSFNILMYPLSILGI